VKTILDPYIPSMAVIRKITTENDLNDLKTFELVIEDPEAREAYQYIPGQFGMLSYFGVGECPIGIASSPTDKGYLQFTVKKMGTVTTALHNCSEGDIIGVRGPYGNGWPIDYIEGKNVVLVGGGFAFTTLRSMLLYMLHDDNRSRFEDITVVYGARSPGELLYKYDLEEWSKREDLNLVLTIDRPAEGWTKNVGFVPAVVKETAPSSENAVTFICGPPVMIRFTTPVLTELGFSPDNILMSLEMRMKCGIGKCGRCNVGNKLVCQDGPVFTQRELMDMPKEY
jgi:sulfhydrogenase subunit gamma (sulfur reductase)